MATIPLDSGGFTVETRDVSPAHFLLKIESFSLLSKQGITKFESAEFAAGDYKWRLVIYPEGHDGENDDDRHISVYLVMSGTASLPVNWEVNAVFSVFLYNQILGNYLCFRGKMCRFNAMKSIWGISKLISKKCLNEPSNGFLVDDNCVFGAEVFVVEKQQDIQCFSVMESNLREKGFNVKENNFLGKQVWTISKFSELKDNCSFEEFSAGGCKWKVHLYPKGSDGEHLSIFLQCADCSPHKRVKADFSICIKNQLNDNPVSISLSHWFGSSNYWGLPNFALIDDMLDKRKGLVVNDCCIIETVVSVRATE